MDHRTVQRGTAGDFQAGAVGAGVRRANYFLLCVPGKNKDSLLSNNSLLAFILCCR